MLISVRVAPIDYFIRAEDSFFVPSSSMFNTYVAEELSDIFADKCYKHITDIKDCYIANVINIELNAILSTQISDWSNNTISDRKFQEVAPVLEISLSEEHDVIGDNIIVTHVGYAMPTSIKNTLGTIRISALYYTIIEDDRVIEVRYMDRLVVSHFGLYSYLPTITITVRGN